MKAPRFVTPEGSLVVQTKKIGLMMGNRGTLRPKHYTLPQPHEPKKAWISCILKKNGVTLPKTDMAYTKLFFIDEVTAFAAGHRPCRGCQASRYDLFAAFWEKLFKNRNFDTILDGERCNEDGSKKTLGSLLIDLPGGVIVKIPDSGQSYLFLMGRLFPWSMEGYGLPITKPMDTEVKVLTPASIVQMLKAGFPLLVNREETIHPSVFDHLS